jgi:hypothetical protein
MSVPLPAFAVNSSELLSSGSLGKSLYRHQKVIVSNLALTIFVKHQINCLNRFHSLPSGKEKKKLKGKNLRSLFLLLIGAKAFRCLSLSLSPFIESIYASQAI